MKMGIFGKMPPSFSNQYSLPVTQLDPTREIKSDLPSISLLRLAFRKAAGHRFRFMRLQVALKEVWGPIQIRKAECQYTLKCDLRY